MWVPVVSFVFLLLARDVPLFLEQYGSPSTRSAWTASPSPRAARPRQWPQPPRPPRRRPRAEPWWDLIWFGVSVVISTGIFVLTGQEASDAAGPAVVVSYTVSGVSDSPPCSPTWALHLLPCSSTSVAAVEKGIYGPYLYWLLWIQSAWIQSYFYSPE